MTTRALDTALLAPTDPPAPGEGVGWNASFRTLWQPFAPSVSPVFTGDPIAPTPAPGDNDNSIATTAFVKTAISGSVAGVASFNTRQGAVTLTNTDVVDVLPGAAAAPLMNGVATVGVAGLWAREDHVHPSDTSRLAKAGGTMTGPLVLAADPVGPLEPVTLQYLQAYVIDAGTY